MDSFTDIQQIDLKEIVSSKPSVFINTDPLAAKRSMLGRRTTSVSRVSIAENAPATLSFHNISYTVGGRQESSKNPFKHWSVPCCKPHPPKQVLFHVSGKFINGMNAILGPSGCGKSSLLDVLADRKDPRGMSGLVLVDGMPRHPSFRYTVGYVVQDDICSGTLTVRENLFFSAHMRMPKDVLRTEKNDRVIQTIRELNLDACADSRVGTEFLRGISGGERKRTCIGMELVLSPKILFLDEPTTGLDASTASTVMNCLKELSRRGRTIIFSIHQPRYSIFKIFDTVLFMCKGHCIYHGLPHSVVPYFSKYGYESEINDNPADYALDVLIDISRKSNVLEMFTNMYNAVLGDALALLSQEANSMENEELERERRKFKVEAARSFTTEIRYLSQRTLRNVVRNPALALSQVMASIIIGFLLGLMFFNLEKTDDPGIQNRLGAIFFIVISQIFSNVTALEPFIKERMLFIHEYASGYYRIFTYFIAKLMCDLLPMRVLPSILFSIIAYFMIGLTMTGGQFFIFLLTIFMASLFGSAMCFFISATISVFAVALIVVILIFVVMMMFSGFLIDLASVFKWLSWIQWISAFRYASNMLTINEFQGLKFCLANLTDVCPITGESILDKRGLSHADASDLWKNFFALTSMATLFFILAYIQLIRTKKTK